MKHYSSLMTKLYYASTLDYFHPTYIRNTDGSVRTFTEQEIDEFLKDKPNLCKVLIPSK